jgi:hypothetical protein
MDDVKTIRLAFDGNGLEYESVEVTEVAPGRYCLHETPVLADPPVYLGDLIEAPPDAGGICQFQRVVERSGFLVSSFLIAREIAESREIIELAEKIEGLGGQTERIFGGFIILHLPPDAPMDAQAELNTVIARVRSRLADQ